MDEEGFINAQLGKLDNPEYIRKDVYDELQTKYDNLNIDCHRFHVANFDLQDCIKKLEDALRGRFKPLSDGTIARNELEKEVD